jgi:hypothetical protein
MASRLAWRRSGRVAEEEERAACDRRGGAEKKTTVGGGDGGGTGFIVHRCGGGGRADGVVPGHGDGADPTMVEAIGEVPVWTWRRWRQSGRQRRGLGGIEERAGNFGSLKASSPNLSVRVYGEGGKDSSASFLALLAYLRFLSLEAIIVFLSSVFDG